jgi:LPS-assembly protein
MKNNILIYYLTIFIFFNISNVYAKEITFNTTEINISNNGNIINAGKGVAKLIEDNIKINANEFKYFKNLLILEAYDGIAVATNDNIEIKAKKFKYNKNLSIINAVGNVEIRDLEKDFLIKSQNIFYYIKDNKVESKTKSYFNDSLNNNLAATSFTYTLNDNLIKFNEATIVDKKKNIYTVEKVFLNVKSNKLIGKDVFINFNDNSFQKNSEPRLKGNSINSDGEITTIEKGVFTTCKRNDDCPPWQFSAKEIKHNKKKKTIYYKNAWLKLYDKPVFYFPKFFHPDPSVKRQSGFLMPTFINSSSLGASLHVPYYHVIADNKDLTFSPRFYSDDKVLLQNEYRMVQAESDHILDFSFMQESKVSGKSHFFSKSRKKLNFENFDESTLSLDIQATSNDTFLKTYKIKSPLILDKNLLTSSLAISAYRDDLEFDVDFKVYENLSQSSGDRYEFVYPAYNLLKHFDSDINLNGDISFRSNGFMKNYDTNVYETVVINDLIFNSDYTISNSGFKNDYKFLIKNVNTDSTNSKEYKGRTDNKLATILEYNSSYPLKRETLNYNDTLKPIISLKYSPNNTKNMRDKNRRINSNNIFSIDRISANDSVEGGASLTYGAEFSKTNKSDKEIFVTKVANILREDYDENLPRNNNLGSKTSDFIGSFNYTPNDNIKFNYDFSLDSNLENKNYELLGSEFKVNNFVTNFEYLNENDTVISQSYLTNKTVFNFGNSQNLLFRTRMNKKTRLTEFYNLMYQYSNDCLIAAIEYNKDYYTDRDLKPEENIFIKLTIIPFGKTSSPNLKK